MRRSPLICMLMILCLTMALPARADDIPVVTIALGSLPFDESPSRFDNSPSKYDNGLSKFENSNGCFENSTSRFDNSPSKYDNLHGTHRLLVEGRVVGYYVVTRHGVTNFFSRRGARVFYNPSKGQGVFDADGGAFVGVLRRVSGVLTLQLDASAVQKLVAGH